MLHECGGEIVANRVGPKGQVVIEKGIRERLGVEAGWLALQQLVGDHVEIYFIPPEHNESLAGILAPYIKHHFPTEADLRAAREAAWLERAREEMASDDEGGQRSSGDHTA